MINPPPDRAGHNRPAGVVAPANLGDGADHLIGHFVDQARRSGASWTDIGESMGVTKQAAQKRFVPKGPEDAAAMDPNSGFARFTPRSRAVIMGAQEIARSMGNDQIGIPHVILGLLDQPEGLAAQEIIVQGSTLELVRAAATAAVPTPEGTVPPLIPFAPEAKKVLELTFREALRLGHNYIGTEHILLALLEQENGLGLFAGLGIYKPQTEAHLVEILSQLLPGQS
ncbi:Clp protease N-terminal domain-containing protein [Nocardia sp. NPDC052566]|uniref:Clp protease N-terminal domain-containing protein n=1 Tax=Nocardia sp. NPDC052566 TaxID=3364330 RepID=UPI0037C81A01